MNVRTLCLSILYQREATGYEVRRLSIDGESAYFVEASFGSIYPALARLEADGLLSSRVEHQSSRPAKKVYSITQAGRNAFVDMLFEPLEDDKFRSPFLLFARFAHLLPPELVKSRLAEQIDRLEARHAKLTRYQAEAETTPADDWILGYGIACMKAASDYLHKHMNDLIAIAQPVSSKKDAAE